MAKKTLMNIIVNKNTTYDLDKIADSNRENSEQELVVQVWKYNPSSSDPNKRNPNPLNPKIGQIWMSKAVDSDDQIE